MIRARREKKGWQERTTNVTRHHQRGVDRIVSRSTTPILGFVSPWLDVAPMGSGGIRPPRRDTSTRIPTRCFMSCDKTLFMDSSRAAICSTVTYLGSVTRYRGIQPIQQVTVCGGSTGKICDDERHFFGGFDCNSSPSILFGSPERLKSLQSFSVPTVRTSQTRNGPRTNSFSKLRLLWKTHRAVKPSELCLCWD